MLSDNFIAKICPDGIIALGQDANIAGLNPAAETMFGWPQFEIIGRPLDLLLPEGISEGQAGLVRAFDKNPIAVKALDDWRVVEARRRGGRRFPAAMRLTSARVDGCVTTTAYIRDMSEIAAQDRAIQDVRAELSRTRQEAELLALAVEHVSDAIVIVGTDGVAIWCNPATEKMTGYTRSELIGARPADLFSGPGTSPETLAKIAEAEHGGKDLRCEMLAYDKSGVSTWVELVLSPIRDKWGRVQKTVGTTRNIALMKKRTRELEVARKTAERAEQRLAMAIDAMSEGFVIYDENDRLVMANDAYRKLRSVDKDILLPGITFEDIVRTAVRRGHYDTEGEDPEEWIAKQVNIRKQSECAETLVRFTDGRWMLRRERRTRQGEMVGVRSDITAFKETEEALRLARENAEAADRAKTEFVANISYELRTPINSIIGFNQLMLASVLTPKQQECAEIIKKSSEHLLQLVNNVLDLSKIVSDCIELEAVPFDLPALLAETILSLTPLARAKGIALLSRTDLRGVIAVTGDPHRLRQILINLLGNAINFTSNGSVTLSASGIGGRFLFEIADTGDGIPQDKLSVIFERFSQVKMQPAQGQGAGLGLAITKSLVDLMDGQIMVESEIGRGSTFSVCLPLARSELPLAAPRLADNRISESLERSRADCGYDVLVAEDHPLNRALITELLGSIGCRVTMADNGQQLLEALDAADFDLVILDNQMPIMNGAEAAEKIRGRNDWKMRIPIIALTADAMLEAERAYRRIGVSEFITKPLDVAHVMETVKRLAATGRRLREQVGIIGTDLKAS
jgi:PAS domain S-box-containing protein